MRTLHRRSAVAGGRPAVGRARLQATVVNWRYDLGSPSVRTHSSAIGDTGRRAFPQGKMGCERPPKGGRSQGAK